MYSYEWGGAVNVGSRVDHLSRRASGIPNQPELILGWHVNYDSLYEPSISGIFNSGYQPSNYTNELNSSQIDMYLVLRINVLCLVEKILT